MRGSSLTLKSQISGCRLTTIQSQATVHVFVGKLKEQKWLFAQCLRFRTMEAALDQLSSSKCFTAGVASLLPPKCFTLTSRTTYPAPQLRSLISRLISNGLADTAPWMLYTYQRQLKSLNVQIDEINPKSSDIWATSGLVAHISLWPVMPQKSPRTQTVLTSRRCPVERLRRCASGLHCRRNL